MAVTYYLLLQDRVEEALDFFGRVNAEQLATQLQYDYFAAYLDFYKAEPKQARQIAAKYADYPVDRWRNAFANIVNQVDEIGKAGRRRWPTRKTARSCRRSEAAATPSFDFTVEAKQVKLNYPEPEDGAGQLLPDGHRAAVQPQSVRASSLASSSRNILPNLTRDDQAAGQGHDAFEFPLPAKLANSNVLVEIVGGRRNAVAGLLLERAGVQVIENYGQVRVTHDKDGKPLPKVYVKVYARMKDGAVKFYKDGYTDLRGRFDYASLSTNELDFVDEVLDPDPQRRARGRRARGQCRRSGRRWAVLRGFFVARPRSNLKRRRHNRGRRSATKL